jgi:uncharacterized protein
MNYELLHNGTQHLLLKAISGSRAYGLHTATSDTDIRGVYVAPKNEFYSLHVPDQFSNASNDIVYYELKKFIDLLVRNNPNILELLCTPKDCIIYKHPLFELLKPQDFLCKVAGQSFAGYAIAQIQKARGLNKKILNPMEQARKGLLDFCWVGQGQGSISLKEWLLSNNYLSTQCGCVAIDHMKNCYHLFLGNHYKGITDKDDVQIVLSKIDINAQPVITFYCNIEGFQKYCLDYNEYWKWVANRNEVRYENTLEHGKNYDAKNMMHTFRLLNMAFEIATEGKIITRRADRDYLLKIRSGAFEYDELVKIANEKIEHIKLAFETCSLPEMPNFEKGNQLLIEMREAWYNF